MIKTIKNKILLTLFSILIIFAFFTGCAAPSLLDEEVYTYAESSDLNKSYDWYRAQMNTGSASGANCGPASVSMAVKYAQNKDVKVEDVRNLYYNGKNWWYTNDIKNALNYYGIGYTVKALISKEQLMASISQGHILLICLNMSSISKDEINKSESKYNRFYENVTGHFIVLKGYMKDQKWFLSYDSNNWQNDYYSDKTPKGRNRLYSIDEVYNSMSAWWPKYFEIM
jgi:hypothetical protein